MKQSKFTDEQIIGFLKQADAFVKRSHAQGPWRHRKPVHLH